MELKKSLDPVNNGFNPGGGSNPKLEGSKQTRESARREEAEGEVGRSAEKDLRDGNWPNTAVLLPGRDEPTGKEPGARVRVNTTAGNILKERSEREKKERILCQRDEKGLRPA